MEILVSTIPQRGHAAPLVPLVRELVRRGHAVRWYAGAEIADLVAGSGATALTMGADLDLGPAELSRRYPERAQLRGLAAVRFDLEHVFLRPNAARMPELQRHLADRPADLLIGDTFAWTVPWLGSLHGLPSVVVGVTPLMLSDPALPPAGPGLAPGQTPLGRLRDAGMRTALAAGPLRPVIRSADRTRRSLGLPATGRLPIDEPADADLLLQSGPTALELPRSRPPAGLEFLGLPRPVVPPSERWRAAAAGRPLVVVTQGTVATEPDRLLRPTLRALARRTDLFVVAVTGGPDPSTLGPQPAHIVVERFVPFEQLLPTASVYVTNGGFGGVLQALASDVPVVVAGTTEDKAEVGLRVRRSGVGVAMRTDRPQPKAIAAAVEATLTDPAYRTAIRRLGTPVDVGVTGADRVEAMVDRVRAGGGRPAGG